MSLFLNRRSAGAALAPLVKAAVPEANTVVLALPRGGVPVGFEVAAALRAPLDVFLVRKLGMPGAEELALGAIASSGIRVLNRDLIQYLRVTDEQVELITNRERLELERKEHFYREGLRPIPFEGCGVVLVDDGLATGASMLAAVRSLRPLVRRTVVAVPVAAKPTYEELRNEVDQIICASTPPLFESVGKWYQDFSPVTDQEVRQLLFESAEARRQAGAQSSGNAEMV